MDRPLVLYELNEGIVLLTLNHPEKRNALSRAMLTALSEHLSRIAGDPAIRVVILSAAGPVFSSGHDLRELATAGPPDVTALFALCTDVMEALRQLPQPVLAQVQGVATAAGCQLAASCDLIVAAEEATFATPGVKIGLFCSTPAVALCRAVPAKKALELLFTGDALPAREAERMGMVNRVVPAGELAETTRRLALQVARASRSTLALGKRAFYEQLPLDLASAYTVAEHAMVANAATADCHEGIQAFLEKRAPRWDS